MAINSVKHLTLHYIQSGSRSGRVRNSGQFSVPGDLVILPGQAVKIRDCLGKNGTDGHLTPVSFIKSAFCVNDVLFVAKQLTTQRPATEVATVRLPHPARAIMWRHVCLCNAINTGLQSLLQLLLQGLQEQNSCSDRRCTCLHLLIAVHVLTLLQSAPS